MDYEKFEKALESLGIVTKTTQEELKKRYLKLSKKYHPDMPNGDAEKFKEIDEAYKYLKQYMRTFKFSLDEDEFYKQNPFLKKSKDWFYGG